MINVNELYLDVLDRINEPENGQLTVTRYNRYAWIAQLNTIDWLSGDVAGKEPPEPYSTQKDRDWLTPFLVPYSVQVKKGKIVKPDDYYRFDNMYLLGQYNEQTNCFEEVVDNGVQCNTPIALLSGDQFTQRCQTYIEGLQPSFKKPISKLVSKNFEFNPQDLGSITLEYIRYPQRATLAMKIDTITHDEVYDASNSVDFEWDEYARGVLVWYIVDQFSNYTREQALKQDNILTGKLSRPDR